MAIGGANSWGWRRSPSWMGRATLMTKSRTMLPPKSFLMASELTDTKIDLREGHLTINKGGRRQRESGGGEQEDDDNQWWRWWACCPWETLYTSEDEDVVAWQRLASYPPLRQHCRHLKGIIITERGGGQLTTMTTKQQQQLGEVWQWAQPQRKRSNVDTGGKQAKCADTWHFVEYWYLLNLIITSSYLFYYHLSSSAECYVSVRRCPLVSTANTSDHRCCSPSSTNIAQCLRLPVAISLSHSLTDRW
jgi:hypothetical protein